MGNEIKEMDPILISQGLQRLQKERNHWRDEAIQLRTERDACRAALAQQRQMILYLNQAFKISRKKAKQCCMERKTDLKLAPNQEAGETSITTKITAPRLSITANRGGTARTVFKRNGGSRVKSTPNRSKRLRK